MYGQVFENLSKATEAMIQTQQELFRTCASCLQGLTPAQKPWVVQIHVIQKKLVDSFGDLLKKQQSVVETQFRAGQEVIDNAFRIPAAKTPEELRVKLEEFRGKLIEYWKKSFECLNMTAEAQMQAFQAAVSKAAEVTDKNVAGIKEAVASLDRKVASV
jgi:hypothetical protein